MSMSILVLIFMIVITASIIALYATGEKFKSVILLILFAVYATHIILTLL